MLIQSFNIYIVYFNISDETTKSGKGNALDSTTGNTFGKSKEMDNTECSEEVDNEQLIMPPSIEDNEKMNVKNEMEIQ